VAGGPNAVVVADMNGDSRLDLVTTNDDGSVSVLTGAGDGTFEDTMDLVGGDGPTAIAVADLNGDGRLDIVLVHSGVSDAGSGPDDLVVLLANRDGTFRRSVRHTGVNAQALAIADLDRDGRADIVTADDGDHVSVFHGQGDGAFDMPTSVPTGGSFASNISVADFNVDGVPDLATANSIMGKGRSDRTVSVLLGRGDGSFATPKVFDTGGSQPVAPVVGDLNGDGVPDITTPNGDPSLEVSVLLGMPDGGLLGFRQYATGPDPHTVVVADLNGDGHPDLAAWNSGIRGGPIGRGLSVLFGVGDGTFADAINVATIADGGEIQAAADLDSDSRPDLVITGDHQLILLFNAIPQHRA
jgi:hypothetical protein